MTPAVESALAPGLAPGLALGGILAVGLLLAAAPWLWPTNPDARRPARPGLVDRLRDRLARAGLDRIGPGGFSALSAILGVLGAAIAQGLVGVPAASLVAGIVAAILPWVVVSSRAARRLSRRRALWPDTVDHLVSAIRSGMSLAESVASLGVSAPVDLREPFAEFAARYRRSGDWNHSLDALKATLADATADRIVETLRMARQVGGSELGAVLRTLSEYLRQEAAIRSELEARQSWLMNAARLGVAAPWLVLFLLGARPEAAAAYASPPGALLILVTVLVSVLAYRLMASIGRLPEERRWFA